MPIKSVQKALVLSPHPDDETFGCGGTINLIATSGGQVDVMYCTRGEAGAAPGRRLDADGRKEISRQREAEARDACSVLGVSEVMFLNGRDGVLQSDAGLVEPLAHALSSKSYRSIFCPWPHDGHTDHAATYRMLHEALSRCPKRFDIWLYEVWTPLPFSICISIDRTIEAKMEAARKHASQMKVLNYMNAFEGLARYRSLFCPPSSYAEAFFNCESDALLSHDGIPWPAVDRMR